jgi:hypothetical protein
MLRLALGEYMWTVSPGPRAAPRASGRGTGRCVTSSAPAGCGARAPQLKDSYDAVIIGGGSHGLATAYYLRAARDHERRVSRRATSARARPGRNTTILRSNYKTPEGARFYDASVKLYEGLSQELNFNLLFSQCGTSRSRTPTARCS